MKESKKHTPRKVLLIIIPIVIITLTLFSFMPPQPIMWGHTGSPSEGNCTVCHGSYVLNSHNGSVQISSIPLMTNNKYILGQTYTISVTVTQMGDSLYAFDFEAVDSLGNDAGNLIVTDSTHTKNITYAVNGRNNMFFNVLGNNYNSFTFKFNWVAPLNGKVSLYANGLVSNINGMTSGDYVYSDSIVNITPTNSSGVLNYLLDKETYIYPNPTKDVLNINCTGFDNSLPINITISDALGKTIYTGHTSDAHYRLNTSAWDKGSYSVSLNQKEKSIHKKIVIE